MCNKDGEIGVFYNICCYKVVFLVDEFCNKCFLVCFYYKWSFKIDGLLLNVFCYFGKENKVMMLEDKVDKGLIVVCFVVWWDIIFVNISGDVEFFEVFIKFFDE